MIQHNDAALKENNQPSMQSRPCHLQSILTTKMSNAFEYTKSFDGSFTFTFEKNWYKADAPYNCEEFQRRIDKVLQLGPTFITPDLQDVRCSATVSKWWTFTSTIMSNTPLETFARHGNHIETIAKFNLHTPDIVCTNMLANERTTLSIVTLDVDSDGHVYKETFMKNLYQYTNHGLWLLCASCTTSICTCIVESINELLDTNIYSFEKSHGGDVQATTQRLFQELSSRWKSLTPSLLFQLRYQTFGLLWPSVDLKELQNHKWQLERSTYMPRQQDDTEAFEKFVEKVYPKQTSPKMVFKFPLPKCEGYMDICNSSSHYEVESMLQPQREEDKKKQEQQQEQQEQQQEQQQKQQQEQQEQQQKQQQEQLKQQKKKDKKKDKKKERKIKEKKNHRLHEKQYDVHLDKLFGKLKPTKTGKKTLYQLHKKPRQYKHQEQQEEEKQECIVCLDTDADTCFTPCNHVVACNTCSLPLTTCPVCRADITAKKTLEKDDDELAQLMNLATLAKKIR